MGYDSTRADCRRQVQSTYFPFCRLWGLRVLDELPRSCPLRSEHPYSELLNRQDGAFRLLATPRADPSLGLAELDRAEVCYRCAGRLLADHRIRQLRQQQWNQRDGESVSPARLRSPSENNPLVLSKRRRARAKKHQKVIYAG